MNLAKRAIVTGLVAAFATAAIGSFPPYAKKHLYATKDIRGHAAPKLAIAEWIQGASPRTQGKTVLIDMWATWCESCQRLIPELNRWSSKFKGKLVVIGVSDEDSKVVRKFMATHEMDYSVGLDPKQRLEIAVGVEGIPHVLVISPDGIVRWQGYPGDDGDKLTDEKLAAIIQAGSSKR